jgi:transcriptional regulator with XRE-family HTH domain
MATIGQKIRECRERKNMSQQELARKIRVGTGTLEKYESGLVKPDTQTLLAISTVLDIPACELVERNYQAYIPIDCEVAKLVQEIGTEKAKMILQHAKDVEEGEFLTMVQKINELKENKFHEFQ